MEQHPAFWGIASRHSDCPLQAALIIVGPGEVTHTAAAGAGGGKEENRGGGGRGMRRKMKWNGEEERGGEIGGE